MNHWALAIESHSSNFEDVLHILGKADVANLSALRDIDLLLASPECRRHSTACGDLRWDASSSESRATAWQVVRYARELNPRWLVVENVRQIKLWEDYDKWIKAIKRLGYNLSEQTLNAADFGVPQNRIRWFLLGDKIRTPPNVKPTTQIHEPAWKVIDWSLDCPSIFSRRKPLAANTLKRVKAGLDMFCTSEHLQPFITKMRTNNSPHELLKPLGTIATGGHHALVVPYILRLRAHHTASDICSPLGTVTAGGGHHAVVMPYLLDTNHQGPPKGRVYPVEGQMRAVTGSLGTALVTPFLLPQCSGGKPKSPGEPLPTMLASGPGASVVIPFVVKYYGTGKAKSVGLPLDTLTTKHRFGLVGARTGLRSKLPKRDKHGIVAFMKKHGIADIGFRMLQPHEIKRGMGFPDEYIIKGNKTERIKQLGNAVPPPVMRAIVKTLCGEE